MRCDKSLILPVIAVVAILLTVPVFATVDNENKTFYGEIIGVNEYQDYVTSITGKDILDSGYNFGDRFIVEIGEYKFGVLFLYDCSGALFYQPIISTDYDQYSNVFLSIFSWSLAEKVKAPMGERIRITYVGESDFMEKYPLISTGYSYSREYYETDEAFANFREITLGNMKICRSCDATGGSSTGLERAMYVNMFFDEYDIEHYVHLGVDEKKMSDRISNLRECEGYYDPVIELYENGDVSPNYASPDFVDDASDYLPNIESIITYVKEGKNVNISCNLGKDRTGIVMIWLEALAGWDMDRIEEDYCLSYCNYYGVQKGSDEYKSVQKDYFGRLVIITAHPELEENPLTINWDAYDYKEIDIKKASESFLLEHVGLSQARLSELKVLMGV